MFTNTTDEIHAHPQSVDILLADASVEQLDVLLAGLHDGVQVRLVTPEDDAILMLADALNTPELDTLHVLGHGAPGEVILGGQRIDADAMPALKNQLTNNASHTPFIDTQICLWSCRTGAELSGDTFMNAFAQTTNATIFATENLVGNNKLGGTWNLEKSVAPRKGVPFSAEALQGFEGVLADPTTTTQSGFLAEDDVNKISASIRVGVTEGTFSFTNVSLLSAGWARYTGNGFVRNDGVYTQSGNYGVATLYTQDKTVNGVAIPAGTVVYALDNARAQTLVAGTNNGSDIFNVPEKNGSDILTASVTFAISGKNDTATISGTAIGSVTEDSLVKASGTLTVSDVDTGENKLQTPASLVGTYGTFTLNTSTGAWDYTLDSTKASVQALGAGATATDTLTVKSSDGTATKAITVTINGANDNATISGTAAGTVTEDSLVKASGTLTVSDVDAGQNKLQTPASLVGTYGTFTLNTSTGAWDYTVDSTK
ncbi:MAG: DUF4347 domain-containing protein, partial [Betaproteobacteria bacterium]|nr:DUF4347 domain-containing protein [Betaproteobacteria bacterium]